MPVTDVQVATLRALLVHDFDEGRRLMSQIGDEGMRKGYFPLLSAAFIDAVMLRFRGKKRSEMIAWVADVRARMDAGNRIDPNVAEQLILWAFGRGSTDGLDFNTDVEHQTTLLALLVEEQGFTDEELDAFLAKARQDVDTAMSQAGE